MFRTLMLSLLAAASPALAQGAPSPSLSGADKDYLVQDAQGAAYELETAKLAAQNASRDDVKAYARKLVGDHETYNAALQQLGHDKGISLPNDLTTADSARLTTLRALSGSLFDKAYIEEATRINADDKQEADKESAATKDETIKSFIQKFASMDAEHEKLAKDLNK